MVERLVANEKVEGSTPFARSTFLVVTPFLTQPYRSHNKPRTKIPKNFFTIHDPSTKIPYGIYTES